jgi:hypothetical protein
MARRGDQTKQWAVIASQLARILNRQPLTMEEAERLYREAEVLPMKHGEVDALVADVMEQLQIDQLRQLVAPSLDLLFSADAIFLHPADIIASEIVYEGTELVTDFDSISVDTRQADSTPSFARRWSWAPGTASVSVDVWPSSDEHDGSSLRNVRLGTWCCDAYLDDGDFDWTQ